MIDRLRKKLILAAMGSLLFVLFLIMSGISCLYYWKIVSDADNILNILAQNDGFFPGTISTSPNRWGKEEHRKHSSELPYETRYFFVLLDNGGSVEMVNTGKVVAIDTETAIEYAQSVWQSGNTHGFRGDYRYLCTNEQGESLILFVDCGRSLDGFRTLVVSSILVSMGGTILVFILLLFFSKKIVRPFSEMYEKQKRFITDAGHELKTPLTIIDADAEILTMDIGQNEWVDEICNQTRRLANLTNDLIFLSRMEETTPTQMKVFSLSQLMQDTVQSFEGVAKTQGKEIHVNIQPALFLCGEEKSIQKLITILLDNALKYMPSPGAVTCGLVAHRNQLQLWVCNPTEGLTKEQTSRLFDRFYRTDDSRNSQTGGYGLGLSIAKAIVTAHKGKITASVSEEHTLTITVSLPQG